MKTINNIVPTGKVTLLAHDWGCLLAYNLVDLHPDKFEKLVVGK